MMDIGIWMFGFFVLLAIIGRLGIPLCSCSWSRNGMNSHPH